MPNFLRIAAMCATLVGAQECFAETVTPKEVEYTAEFNDPVCQVVVTILSLPSPESLNFKLLAFTGPNGAFYTGFSLDVGDMKFANGLPAGIQQIAISSANFVSPNFASPGRLITASLNSFTITGTTNDPETGVQLATAVQTGDFAISFTRTGLPTVRTYQISQAPPPEVFARFSNCIQRIIDRQGPGQP